MNRDTYIYRIKKKQDHQLMVNYYTAYVMFDDLPKERDLLLEAIRHRYEAIMDKFNLSLFLIFLILCILKTALIRKNKNR